jgi:LacI family transcriptional regulator
LRPTIKDVAKAVGLSTTTVSLVLNNKPNRTSPAKREAIFKAAKDLDYRPNRIAVSMVTKKTHTIGLILPDISNLYFSELAKVIEEECKAYGYTVLYGNTSDSVESDFEYLNIFIDSNVDAIIIILSASFNEADKTHFDNIIDNNNIPVVILDRSINDKNKKSVLLDQQLGGYLATNYLIHLGHTKIGCITGPQNVASANERLSGYMLALSEAGIPFDENLIIEEDFSVEGGARALPYLLGQSVTAVFASNDMMAIGVYRACSNFHLRIPHNLSVVGFDDIFLSEFIEPPLTTISQPIDKLAKEAVNQILLLLRGETADKEDVIFKPVLKVRGSAISAATSLKII